MTLPDPTTRALVDALAAAGVESTRVYSDMLSGTSTRQQRPGLDALLDYARQGDAIVGVGIDRLGRNAAEVMTSIRELGERRIVLWHLASFPRQFRCRTVVSGP